MPHSGCHFLRFWRILVPKVSILEPPWRPAGHQMTTQIAQVVPIMLHAGPPGTVSGIKLFPRSLSERSWAPFLRIFDGFWPPFQGFFRFLTRFLISIWAIVLHAAQNWPAVLLQTSSKKKKKEQMQSTNIFRKSSWQNSQGRRCYGLWPHSIKPSIFCISKYHL